MYNIITRQPLETTWPSLNEPRFFRKVNYGTVRKAFSEKGWNMWLQEMKPGEVRLHWDSLRGEKKNWVDLDPFVLGQMLSCKQDAIAWLQLFATDAEQAK